MQLISESERIDIKQPLSPLHYSLCALSLQLACTQKHLQLWGARHSLTEGGQGVFPHCLIPYSLSVIHQVLQQLPQVFVTGQVKPFSHIDNAHPSKALEL